MIDNIKIQIATLAGAWLGGVCFAALLKLLDYAPKCLRWRHIAAAVWMPALCCLCWALCVAAVAFILVLLEDRRGKRAASDCRAAPMSRLDRGSKRK